MHTPETLRSGHIGQPVMDLQDKLELMGYEPGPLDGCFGPRTARAVRRFQTDWDLRATGIADGATLSALDDALQGWQRRRQMWPRGARQRPSRKKASPM